MRRTSERHGPLPRSAHAHSRPTGVAHAGHGPTVRQWPVTGRPARVGHLCESTPALRWNHPAVHSTIPWDNTYAKGPSEHLFFTTARDHAWRGEPVTTTDLDITTSLITAGFVIENRQWCTFTVGSELENKKMIGARLKPTVKDHITAGSNQEPTVIWCYHCRFEPRTDGDNITVQKASTVLFFLLSSIPSHVDSTPRSSSENPRNAAWATRC